jgi:cytochrome c-type biogenesis protein CcmH
MTTFIIAALLITFTALAILLRPLYTTQDTDSFERRAQNIHFAKERLAELEEQLKNASISAADYEALKLEIENTLADDIDLQSSEAAPQPVSTKSNTGIIIALSILLPLAGLGSYWLLGTPEAFQARPASVESEQDIDSMVASVEERLKQNPEDVQAWTILSRTYLALGRYAEAKNGFLNLLELEGESVDILTSLADASALMAGGVMQGEPSSYIKRALALQPKHPQALWLAGLSAAQQNEFASARDYWNQLLPLLQDNPQQQQELREIIQQTLAESGIDTGELPKSEEPLITKADPVNDQSNAQKSTEVTTGLQVRVTLAESLIAQTNPNDLVFVFARAQQGPPAPLAVKRLVVADLPATVLLSDADAMMAQLKLSLFKDVVISARVARSGNPVAQPGDLQSKPTASLNNNANQVELLISDIVE